MKNRVINKDIILVEFILGFSFIGVAWLLASSALLFFSWLNPFLGLDLWGLVSFLTCVGGGVGFYGISMLLRRLMNPSVEHTPPTIIKITILIGVVAAVVPAYALGLGINLRTALFLIPILITLHFLYLDREYLWKNS